MNDTSSHYPGGNRGFLFLSKIENFTEKFYTTKGIIYTVIELNVLHIGIECQGDGRMTPTPQEAT